MATEIGWRLCSQSWRHSVQALWLVVTVSSAVGCGPSIGDLVARREWRAAVSASSSLEDLEEIQVALRSRVTGRVFVRAYTPEELVTLLGHVPVALRIGGAALVAFRAEVHSPDAAIIETEVDFGQDADSIECCGAQVGWDELNGRFQPIEGSSDVPSWLATARDFMILFATPAQTIVGTLRDGLTIATSGAVTNTPVSGPGLDLSVGAILARMGIGGSVTPSPDAEAAAAAQDAQARARLHALLAVRCAPSGDLTCTRFVLVKPVGPMREVFVRFAYRFDDDPERLTDRIVLRVPPADSCAARLQAMFPAGARGLSEFPWLRFDDATMRWVEP